MRVWQAYRFALDPSPTIQRACRAHVGAKRFAYNWGLALVTDRLAARRRGEPVTVPSTLPALRREWNQHKAVVAPWWPEHSKEAYSSGLDALARALRNHRESRQGRRKGRRIGFPAFRKKGRGRQSVRFTTGAIRVEDRTHIKAPQQYPSSKRCARCGAVKATLPWWVRVFHCEACGTVLDRDDNAAQNLAALVAAVAGSGPETPHARGRDVRPRTLGQTRMKREAGSRPSRQTGTPMPQGVGA